MNISYDKNSGQYTLTINAVQYANLNNGLGCAMRLSEKSNHWNDRLGPSDLKCCDAMDKAMLEAYQS